MNPRSPLPKAHILCCIGNVIGELTVHFSAENRFLMPQSFIYLFFIYLFIYLSQTQRRPYMHIHAKKKKALFGTKKKKALFGTTKKCQKKN